LKKGGGSRLVISSIRFVGRAFQPERIAKPGNKKASEKAMPKTKKEVKRPYNFDR